MEGSGNSRRNLVIAVHARLSRLQIRYPHHLTFVKIDDAYAVPIGGDLLLLHVAVERVQMLVNTTKAPDWNIKLCCSCPKGCLNKFVALQQEPVNTPGGAKQTWVGPN
jgi:hypothetical protein